MRGAFISLAEVEVFDLDAGAGTWSLDSPLPIQLHGLQAVIIDDTIFAISGSIATLAVRLDGKLYVYRP